MHVTRFINLTVDQQYKVIKNDGYIKDPSLYEQQRKFLLRDNNQGPLVDVPRLTIVGY